MYKYIMCHSLRMTPGHFLIIKGKNCTNVTTREPNLFCRVIVRCYEQEAYTFKRKTCHRYLKNTVMKV